MSQQYKKTEPGVVTYVEYGKEDHGILTCSVGIDFGGMHQAFGGLCLTDTTGPEFVRELCGLFGAAKLEDIKGRRCVGCWHFGTWNEYIDGLVVGGRHFSIQEFREKHHPETLSPVEAKRKHLREQVELYQRRALEANGELLAFEREYPRGGKS